MSCNRAVKGLLEGYNILTESRVPQSKEPRLPVLTLWRLTEMERGNALCAGRAARVQEPMHLM